MEDDRLVKRAAMHEQLIEWRIIQDHLPTGGTVPLLRHRRLGVKPSVWEVPLEQVFLEWQRSTDQAEQDEVTARLGRLPICWWDIAQDRPTWDRLAKRAV